MPACSVPLLSYVTDGDTERRSATTPAPPLQRDRTLEQKAGKTALGFTLPDSSPIPGMGTGEHGTAGSGERATAGTPAAKTGSLLLQEHRS